MEREVAARAKSVGAASSIIRAGTLKGGAVGGSIGDENGGGDPRFLNSYFYQLGQQDVVNWRLLFDCDALGVEMVRRSPPRVPFF